MQIYDFMKDEYDCDFIAVPLMIDMTFMMEKVNGDSPKSAGYIRRIRHGISRKALESQNKVLSWLGDTVLPKGSKELTSNSSVNFFKNSYEVQLKELIALKKLMPDKIYPFFSIDPRRDKTFKKGVIGEIKKYVGKDKYFSGIKLYTGLGYSPTDPALYKGKNSVYAWCEKNKIPITAHFGYSGVSHVLTENQIEGDIYYSKSGEVIPIEEYSISKTIKYRSNYMGNTDEMIQERQLMHNHPKLWRKVLEKYPKLKINFAHMGGNEQVKAYAQGKKMAFWTSMVIELMEEYPNVYCDLSCFYTPNDEDFGLRDVYDKVYLKMSKKARRKVMYGSDFYMVLLYKPSLKGYVEEFKREFGNDFEKIAYDNPAVFMGFKRRFF